MKIKNHNVVTVLGTKPNHVFILDLNDDLILSEDDLLNLFIAHQLLYGKKPFGVWINKNQAYNLTKRINKFIGNKIEYLDLDTVQDVHIYIYGRDEL